MFKRGTFTIATQSPVHPVRGHVFNAQDITEGVVHQHAIIFPGAQKEPRLRVRAPGPGEPGCQSLGDWSEQVPSLWGRCHEFPEQYALYVIARAQYLKLPFEGPLPRARTSRSPFWFPSQPSLPDTRGGFEQWDPEFWVISLPDRVAGVLHVWEPEPLGWVDAPFETSLEIPAHPSDSALHERVGVTYELWYFFDARDMTLASELQFSIAESKEHLPSVERIVRGEMSQRFPDSRCVIAACSYYKAPQALASQGTARAPIAAK